MGISLYPFPLALTAGMVSRSHFFLDPNHFYGHPHKLRAWNRQYSVIKNRYVIYRDSSNLETSRKNTKGALIWLLVLFVCVSNLVSYDLKSDRRRDFREAEVRVRVRVRIPFKPGFFSLPFYCSTNRNDLSKSHFILFYSSNIYLGSYFP